MRPQKVADRIKMEGLTGLTSRGRAFDSARLPVNKKEDVLWD